MKRCEVDLRCSSCSEEDEYEIDPEAIYDCLEISDIIDWLGCATIDEKDRLKLELPEFDPDADRDIPTSANHNEYGSELEYAFDLISRLSESPYYRGIIFDKIHALNFSS